MLTVTGPKRRVIAKTPITGLDFSDKNDIRLMINMLNESLNTASELAEEEGKSSFKGVRTKYKEGLVEFYEGMEDKTFMVPASTHKKKKKASERNADLKQALRSWKLSETKFTTEEEIDKMRIEGDPDCFYWKTIRIYTQNPIINYNYNLLISTESDEVIIGFLGKKRLKPATIEKIQKKVVAKAERYKKQLAK